MPVVGVEGLAEGGGSELLEVQAGDLEAAAALATAEPRMPALLVNVATLPDPDIDAACADAFALDALGGVFLSALRTWEQAGPDAAEGIARTVIRFTADILTEDHEDIDDRRSCRSDGGDPAGAGPLARDASPGPTPASAASFRRLLYESPRRSWAGRGDQQVSALFKGVRLRRLLLSGTPRSVEEPSEVDGGGGGKCRGNSAVPSGGGTAGAVNKGRGEQGEGREGMSDERGGRHDGGFRPWTEV
ncbi:hypothetical protein OG711_38225 [Streptomyces uncialis]|uniref:hypothetical protein n=1 Tax=Streptomyces uncialis TaxID=1048205 RepID=UPI002E34008F|nr:hypothetical protein [Streptomyces uncialis]